MRKDEIQREKEDGSMKATVEGWKSRTKNEMVKRKEMSRRQGDERGTQKVKGEGEEKGNADVGGSWYIWQCFSITKKEQSWRKRMSL